MQVFRLREDSFRVNNYLIIKNGSALLIDASDSVENIKKILIDENAKLKAVLLTHSHFDHILTLNSLINEFNCPVYIKKDGLQSLYDAEKNLSIPYGNEKIIINNEDNIITFSDNTTISVNNFNINVYATPGHTSCSVCYGIENALFTGDTIFKVCIGRNDLWNSDKDLQQKSLKFLETLKPFEAYYPGHGISFNYDSLQKVIKDNLI